MGWGQRTFSFSSYSYTGVGQGAPGQPDVNSMARAAASSVGSNPNERANSGLSSAAAAAAIRRHSLTSSTSQPNLQQQGGRNGSMRGGREGRTNSLLGGRTNSLMGGRKSSLRGGQHPGGFASVSGTNASGRAPDLIEEESGSVGDLPNVRKGKRGNRTYSLTTPFEGFEDGGIGAGMSPAQSPNNSISSSVASPGRTSSLRHSLRGAPSSGSLRRGSMTSTTTNTERTHSLTSTTTTIKRMGSFHVITTKTQEVPAGGKPAAGGAARSRLSQGGGAKPAYQTRDLLTQQRQEREARQQQLNKTNRAKAQKEQRLRQQQVPVVHEPEPPGSPVHYASSVLSYESDLNTVSEYPESSLTSPNGSVGSGKRHMPPPRTLSPMKPALKVSESPRNSFTQDSNSLSPHSSIDSPSRSRKQRVSFSSESESNFIAQESQRQKALLSLPQQQPAAKQPLQPRPKQYSPGTVVPVSNNQLASNGLPKVVKTPERQSQLAQEQAHQQALKHAKMHTPGGTRGGSKRESQQYVQPKRESQRESQQFVQPKTKKAQAHPVQQPRQPTANVLSPMLSQSESEEDLSMFQDAHEHLGSKAGAVKSPVPVSLVKKAEPDSGHVTEPSSSHVGETKTEPDTGHVIEPPVVTTIGDVQEAQDEAAAYNEVMGDVEEPVAKSAAVPDSPSRFGAGVFGSVASAVSGAVAAADQFGKQMQFNPSESTLDTIDTGDESVYEEDVTKDHVSTLQPPAQLHVNTDAANASSDVDDLPTPKLASSQFSGSPSSPSARRNYRQYALGGMPVPSSSDIDAVSPSNHKFSPSSGSIGSNYTHTGPGAPAVTIPDYSVDVEKPRDSVYAESHYEEEPQYETTASQFVSHTKTDEDDEEEDVPVKAFGNLKTSPRLGASEGPGSGNIPALASSSPKAVVHPPSDAAPVPVEYPTLDPGSPNAPRQPSPAKKVGFAEEEEVVEHVPHPEGPMDDAASIESDSSWRRERRAGTGPRGGVNSTNGGVSEEGYRLTLRDDAGYGRDMPQEPYSMRAPQFRKPKEEFREQSPARHAPQEPQYGFAAVREQQNNARGRGQQQGQQQGQGLQARASMQPQARRGSVPAQPALVRSNSASSFDRGSRSNSMSAFRMGSMREPRTSLRQDVPPVPALPSGMSAGPVHSASRFADTDSDDEGPSVFSGGAPNTSPRKKRGMRFFSSSKEEMRPAPAPVTTSEPGLGKKLFSSTKTLKKQQAEAQGGYAQFTQQPSQVVAPEPQMIESVGTAGSAGKQKKFGKLRRVFRLD